MSHVPWVAMCPRYAPSQSGLYLMEAYAIIKAKVHQGIGKLAFPNMIVVRCIYDVNLSEHQMFCSVISSMF